MYLLSTLYTRSHSLKELYRGASYSIISASTDLVLCVIIWVLSFFSFYRYGRGNYHTRWQFLYGAQHEREFSRFFSKIEHEVSPSNHLAAPFFDYFEIGYLHVCYFLYYLETNFFEKRKKKLDKEGIVGFK